jgi:hypothetical protein
MPGVSAMCLEDIEPREKKRAQTHHKTNKHGRSGRKERQIGVIFYDAGRFVLIKLTPLEEPHTHTHAHKESEAART